MGLRTHSASMTYEAYETLENPIWHVFTDEEMRLGDVPKIEKNKPKKPNKKGKY